MEHKVNIGTMWDFYIIFEIGFFFSFLTAIYRQILDYNKVWFESLNLFGVVVSFSNVLWC